MSERLTDAEREALLASDLALDNLHTEWGQRWLWDAVEGILAARLAEQAEQIAQAIEADRRGLGVAWTDYGTGYRHGLHDGIDGAARIARNHGAAS